MQIPFSKYHGLGNDFILFDQKEIEFISPKDYSKLAEKVCNRHTGIGADGMIVLKQNPLEMIYYNQDGSRAPMCGNGIRCFSAFYKDQGYLKEPKFPVETLAGIQIVEVTGVDPFTVRVNMNTADFDPKKIGAKEKIWKKKVGTCAGELEIYSFFLGTVHTVVFVDEDFSEFEAAGKELCHHPLFENQTNVNFVTVKDRNHLKVTTYERGCGLTLACGTGICASAFAAYRNDLANQNVQVQAALGTLNIEIDDQETVFMSGPAKRICKGEYDYD